ncbi:MAG: glyoxalase, partial [Candidatus Paceibacterota bacterium]
MTELVKTPVLAARGGCWFGGDGFEINLGVKQDFAPALKAHPGILVRDLTGQLSYCPSRLTGLMWCGTR